uniref:Uncharacterized protein n=1 Tax=Anguilla anguilla TaxID=7936 RepID=A0A0E9QQN8_ANGAN
MSATWLTGFKNITGI